MIINMVRRARIILGDALWRLTLAATPADIRPFVREIVRLGSREYQKGQTIHIPDRFDASVWFNDHAR